MHGAHGNAFAAADAMRLGRHVAVFLPQDSDGIGPLGYGNCQVKLGHAHHGTAGEDLIRVLPEARRLHHIAKGSANGDQQVPGLHDNVAGNGDHSLHQGHPVPDGVSHGGAGGGVEHGAAHGGRQSPRGHLAAGEGLDQLFFSPLGVPGL